jgi:hypothetical protein
MFVGCRCLAAALLLAQPFASRAQPPSSAARPASAVDPLPILPKDPEQGHLLPGQQVLVDDGRCPAGQIKEVTGGSNRKCPVTSGLADTTKCDPATGSRRTSRCVARP